MKCYLCGVNQDTYKLGIRDICLNCKLKTDKAREEIKISSQYWILREQQLEHLKLSFYKLNPQN